MIIINLDKIHVKTAKNQAGVFTGNNNVPNWSYFSKSNTNVSGNHVSDTVNVLIDEDGYDFTVIDNDKAIQKMDTDDIIINKAKKANKMKHNRKSKMKSSKKSKKSCTCKKSKSKKK